MKISVAVTVIKPPVTVMGIQMKKKKFKGFSKKNLTDFGEGTAKGLIETELLDKFECEDTIEDPIWQKSALEKGESFRAKDIPIIIRGCKSFLRKVSKS